MYVQMSTHYPGTRRSNALAVCGRREGASAGHLCHFLANSVALSVTPLDTQLDSWLSRVVLG